MDILKENYNGWKIYYLETEKELLNLGKKLANGTGVEVIETYKESQRNYVAKIRFNNKYYVLKSPRNEYRIPQRRFGTLFKAGEALTTLKNITKLRKEGLEELVAPLLVVVRRTKGMIKESYIVFEYKEGIDDIRNHILEMIEVGDKLHSLGSYHGDFNPSNFIWTDEGIKIIDTQGKKSFTPIKRRYDFITLDYDNIDDFDLYAKHKKDIWYYIALFIKKYKRNNIVEKIKKWKKKKRDKGWKI